MATLEARLDRIESMLLSLVTQQTVRDWYSTNQFADLVGLADVTVRGHCRSGRLRAHKQRSGRGAHTCWALSHDELRRYEQEWLLAPVDRNLSPDELKVRCHVSGSDAR